MGGKMTRWSLGHVNLLNIIHEIENSTPRVAVIVGVALIDDCLTDALKSAIKPLPKPHMDRLFGERGSIRDLALKIDLGYLDPIGGAVWNDSGNPSLRHSRPSLGGLVFC
jgi:hypothetical protein